MKKFLKVVLCLFGSILLVLLGLVIAFWLRSPGKAMPITNPEGKTLPGSISSIEKVILGGVEQYLIIRGADSTAPVMLFLHGGPGSPEFAFMNNTNKAIEENYVMVYWEQRGAGKSWSKLTPVESMNREQFISDTRELAEFLSKRFNREKVFLMGHSWGSLLGISTAHRYPELFHAYFGIGQVAHQYRGERVSFDWMTEKAHKRNDEKALQWISAVSFPDSLADAGEWKDFLMNERKFVAKYGGAFRGMKSMLPLIKMVLDAKEYTLRDKINYQRGAMFSLETMWLDVINANLFTEIDSMQVPVYFFHGVHDYQTPYVVAKEFYDQLKAPEKGFFKFENSAHSPLMEEVEKFNLLVREITNRFKQFK
jgi:pimeloyl-ACP methyl ester carboxylesterase